MDLPPIIGPGAPFHTVAIPALHTAPPDIRNAHLIPAHVAAQMAPAWETRDTPPRAIRFHALHDVYVIGEGLVFDSSLQVIAPSMTQYTHAETARARAALAAAIAADAVPHMPGTTLLCQKRGMDNFGHWLIELLPIAHLARRWLRTGEWSVLTPAPADPAMAAVVADSLAALGIPPGAIRTSPASMKLGAPCHAAELVLVDGLSLHGVFLTPPIIDAMDALMAAIPPDPPAPLWISRAHEPRHLWNEPELEAILRTLGWRVISPGSMPLGAQIAACKGATAIAGVHGAGLTGLVFAAPGTPVTTFAPAAMPDTFFWLLATLRRLPYTEVRSPQGPAVQAPTPWDTALILSLPDILRELRHPR